MKFIVLALVLFMPFKAKAQCSTSTCINLDIIGTAQNVLVEKANPEANILALTGKSPNNPDEPLNCDTAIPIPTGAKVYRWFAPDRERFWINYDDSFCVAQGCDFNIELKVSAENPDTGQRERDENGRFKNFASAENPICQ